MLRSLRRDIARVETRAHAKAENLTEHHSSRTTCGQEVDHERSNYRLALSHSARNA